MPQMNRFPYELQAHTLLKSEEEYLLHHDYLTGLYSRSFYEKEKTRLDSSGVLPLSIISGDINGLALINTVLGHESGDIVIISAAKIFETCCRESDFISRTGGGEFKILLPGTDDKTAAQIIHQISAACEEYNRSSNNDLLHINLSIGYATKDMSGININAIEAFADENMRSCKHLQNNNIRGTIVSSIRSTLNTKSHETAEHAKRLAVLARKIGEKMQLPSSDLNELELYGTLHDVGKIAICDDILNKPGKLSPAEWTQMKLHVEIGYNIAMSSSVLKPIAGYILSHHEKWNGSGYPRGLSGEMIPLPSRILAVADAYDAMTQDRVYRTAIGKEAALEEIRLNTGSMFDPAVVEIFLQLVEE